MKKQLQIGSKENLHLDLAVLETSQEHECSPKKKEGSLNSTLIEATHDQNLEEELDNNNNNGGGNDDNDDEEELSDLISLPSITLTNDEYFKWIKERASSTAHPTTVLTFKHDCALNDSNSENNNLAAAPTSSAAIVANGLYRSDTMTTTYTFGSLNNKNGDESLSEEEKPLNDDDDEDDEIDDEIVERNLNFTRKYVDEFKRQQQKRLIECHQQTPKNAMTKVPRLIIQEEETEETTETHTKPMYVNCCCYF